jgi:hypothetical protein
LEKLAGGHFEFLRAEKGGRKGIEWPKVRRSEGNEIRGQEFLRELPKEAIELMPDLKASNGSIVGGAEPR